MAEAYAKLVLAGKKTLEQVPEKLRDEVQVLLEEAGWVSPAEEENA